MKKKILIAEDDEASLNLYKAILAEYPFEAFMSPVRALNCFMDAPEDFWLLITDAIMPEMHGFDLIKSIKKVEPGIRVMLVTGHSGKDEVPEIDRLILKPIRLADLREEVQRIREIAG